MRIIKFLFKYGLMLAILVLVGFFVFREALLLYAMADIKSSLSMIKKINAAPKAYIDQCRQKGSTTEIGVIEQLQLKFTTDRDYQVEIVCSQFKLDPIVIKSNTLPIFVNKVPGSSGIVWGEQLSGFQLKIWGRKRAIIVEDEEIIYQSFLENSGITPVSSCQGYGFTCCDNISSVGEGLVYSQVSDCPRSCYSYCSPRPIVLSFTSDPFMDTQSRTAVVSKGETTTFSYYVESPTDQNRVMIDFGDGSQEELSEKQGSFEHIFSCPSESCQYSANLQVIDGVDRVSAVTAVSQINIIVK